MGRGRSESEGRVRDAGREIVEVRPQSGRNQSEITRIELPAPPQRGRLRMAAWGTDLGAASGRVSRPSGDGSGAGTGLGAAGGPVGSDPPSVASVFT
jgi:hypothetical protein